MFPETWEIWLTVPESERKLLRSGISEPLQMIFTLSVREPLKLDNHDLVVWKEFDFAQGDILPSSIPLFSLIGWLPPGDFGLECDFELAISTARTLEDDTGDLVQAVYSRVIPPGHSAEFIPNLWGAASRSTDDCYKAIKGINGTRIPTSFALSSCVIPVGSDVPKFQPITLPKPVFPGQAVSYDTRITLEAFTVPGYRRFKIGQVVRRDQLQPILCKSTDRPWNIAVRDIYKAPLWEIRARSDGAHVAEEYGFQA
ncbi:hypothetical protein NLI96_g12027 [Meripilus lineatus]|uniref:Uncharacterized protein n=1 Tax=Meripilus lineatus TaxID=2056292 RepID=A0AAD5UUS3_9APHY|nr:hypothetical protein NLI96_g12027 [Physisporinus lineatus]